MNRDHYLNILWSALFTRYVAIYVPLILAALFSQQVSLLLPFTACYWLIAGALVILEKNTCYVEIQESEIIWRYFFSKTCITVNSIIAIKMTYAEQIIGKPRAVEIAFNKADGSVGRRYILLHQFHIDDIRDFSSAISKIDPRIEIDNDLIK
jgi:hypothetical protein